MSSKAGTFICVSIEAEGVGVVFDHVLHVIVKEVGIHAEDLGGIDGQGAVDEYRDFLGQLALVVEVVQQIHNLVCAADGERRDDEFAAFLHAGVVDDLQQLLLGVSTVAVEAVTVGGLGDKVVAVREGLG